MSPVKGTLHQVADCFPRFMYFIGGLRVIVAGKLVSVSELLIVQSI